MKDVERTSTIDVGELKTKHKRRGRPPGKKLLSPTKAATVVKRRLRMNTDQATALAFYRGIAIQFIRDIDPGFTL